MTISTMQKLDLLKSQSESSEELKELINSLDSDCEEKAALFFEASEKYSNFKFESYKDLLLEVEKITKHECFEEFLDLPYSHQESILLSSVFWYFSQPKEYLLALKLAGNPKPVNVIPGWYVQGFLEAINEADKLKRGLDFNASIDEILSKKFQEQIHQFSVRVKGGNLTGGYTTLMLLWVAYGESRVLEVLTKYNLDSNGDCDLRVIMKLLEDFENLKDYPIAWIKELC